MEMFEFAAQLDMQPHELNKLCEVTLEMKRGLRKFGPYNSRHEAYAVILEEMDELWEEIRSKKDNRNDIEEAKQVAALALRYVIEFGEGT